MQIFETSPIAKGLITPQDLLQSAGGLSFETNKDSIIRKGGFLFRIVDEGFTFSFGAQNGKLVVQRNEVISALSIEEFNPDEPLVVMMTWGFDKLCLYALQKENEKFTEVETTPTTPPNSLISWAKKRNILPTSEYDSEELFRSKVCSCLQQVQEQINEMPTVSPFWDIQYEGAKIINRIPKKEPDVHPLISALLSDKMLASSVEIIPEYSARVGSLDFMFLATVKGRGLSYVCVEVKNAHSPDLLHGLEHQLPAYMKSKNVTYGFYCVLNYRGEWFDKPSLSEEDLFRKLMKAQISSSDPYVRNIRPIIYDVGKWKTASK